MSTAFGARRSRRFTARMNKRVEINRTRPALRTSKRAEARAPIPTGLRHSAQGCRVREATLGNVIHYFPQPQRGCVNRARVRGHNPFRVVDYFDRSPRVARTSQPWAERRYPVGVKTNRAVTSGESRTLAALRDALLPKLLSGELRLPAALVASAQAGAPAAAKLAEATA